RPRCGGEILTRFAECNLHRRHLIVEQQVLRHEVARIDVDGAIPDLPLLRRQGGPESSRLARGPRSAVPRTAVRRGHVQGVVKVEPKVAVKLEVDGSADRRGVALLLGKGGRWRDDRKAKYRRSGECARVHSVTLRRHSRELLNVSDTAGQKPGGRFAQ